jgi:hypothetical protein
VEAGLGSADGVQAADRRRRGEGISIAAAGGERDRELSRCCVPLKFTAGLHHPIRHSNDSVQTKMHGFINVFAAAAIAYAHRAVDAQQVQAILEDEDAAGLPLRR